MTGMPERIWANEIYDPDWRRIPDSVWDRDPWAGAAEYIRADIVAKLESEIELLRGDLKGAQQRWHLACEDIANRDAEIERLKARNELLEKVADQLADGVQVVTITKENQHQYSRGYRYVGEDAVVTEGVATCGVDCMSEAAAYLRERTLQRHKR